MDLPHRDGIDVEAANEYRDRLLGCLDPAAFSRPAAQERYEEMIKAGESPANDEHPLIAQWVTLNAGNDKEDLVIGPLRDPVAAFGAQFLNTTPSIEAIAKILPAMKTLSDAIATAPPVVLDEALAQLAWCALAIARTDVITDEQAAILLPIVMAAGASDDRPPLTGGDSDQPASGQRNGRRSTGARAITALARHPSCLTTDTREAIRCLSADPSRAARDEVAANFLALFKTDQDFMWELIHQWEAREQDPTVLGHIVYALHRLPTSMAHKTVPVTITIFNRTTDDEEGRRIREGCIHTWVGLALLANDVASRAMLNQLIASPAAHAHDLQQAIVALEGYLPSKKPGVTTGAFGLLLQIITSVVGARRTQTTLAGTPRTVACTRRRAPPWRRWPFRSAGSRVRCRPRSSTCPP